MTAKRSPKAPHIARLAGTCQGCGNQFVLHHDEIVRHPRFGNMHVTCIDKD